MTSYWDDLDHPLDWGGVRTLLLVVATVMALVGVMCG